MKSHPDKAGSISAKSRVKRFDLFIECMNACNIHGAHILDVGGTMQFWNNFVERVPEGLINSVDVVNLPPRQECVSTIRGVEFNVYCGNALDLTNLKRTNYDVVFSNSVIEHVGSLRAQRDMGRKIQELGNFYWVQTPAKVFPIEPHFYFPFFPYLPLSLRSFLYANFSLGFMQRAGDPFEGRIACDETRLLNLVEVKGIFVEATVLVETLGFLSKSYIATNMADSLSRLRF